MASHAEEQGRQLAEEFRQQNGLGRASIPDMIDILATAGLDVVIMDVPDDSGEEGLTMYDPELDVTVVAVATSPVSGRQRFTLAHELAHFLRGEHMSGNEAHQGRSTQETVAHAFARHLLLPLEAVWFHWREQNPQPLEPAKLLNQLVRLYDVSPAVALIQMKKVGVPEEDLVGLEGRTVTNLALDGGWIDLARQRAAEAMQSRGPRRLLARLAAAHKDGFVPISELADWSGMTVAEIGRALSGDAGEDE